MNVVQIRRRFTAARRVRIGLYRVSFKAGCQKFDITCGIAQTRDAADWFRDMFALALERVIQEAGAK